MLVEDNSLQSPTPKVKDKSTFRIHTEIHYLGIAYVAAKFQEPQTHNLCMALQEKKEINIPRNNHVNIPINSHLDSHS